MVSNEPGTALQENYLDESNFHRVKPILQNKSGIPYYEFKKTLTPIYKKVWVDIALGWTAIITVILASVYVFATAAASINAVCAFVGAILIGFLVNYLVNFFHEAAHFNICRDKQKNDILANIFIGIFIGQGIKNYRVIHWQHHVALGSTADTERSYFESLNLRFFILSLSGLSAIQFLFNRHKFISTRKNIDQPLLKMEKYQMLFFSMIFHISILTTGYFYAQYWLMLTWILSIVCFYPFFNRLRQLIEHRSDDADKKNDYNKIPHGKLSRLFGNSAFDKTFGSAGFNKHLLHHLEPGISYTRMKELESFLHETIVASELGRKKSSYRNVFKKLYRK